MSCTSHHEKTRSGLLVVLGIFYFSCVQPTVGQGLNNLWMGGLEGENPQPFGGVDLDFLTGELVVSYVNRDIDFSRTCATITNEAGALLFSTNGSFVAKATGETMQNGSGLNPGPYVEQYPNGLHINQAALIIPDPGSESLYYIFHNTVDNSMDITSDRLYVSIVDMSLDGGLGGVTNKNQVLFEENLNIGKLTAVRHGNGRDWWIFCHQANSARYYRFLVDPNGISGPLAQDIGEVWDPQGGQVCFSQDGTRFANYWSVTNLDIFDFDRCSGEFFNPVHIPITDGEAVGGVAFSPNSQLLYVSSYVDAYQFDVMATDIASSMVHIAQWDTFYSPSPPFATVFDMAQLAPDGKIYISTANGTQHLHVINNPDVSGLGCNMVQHQLQLPCYFANSIPNHPNYHLGALVGSACDTLGLGIPERPPPLNLSAYPNPSAGVCTLSYAAQGVVGVLEVRDLAGRMVLRELLPAWSTIHALSLKEEAAGLYHCTVHWGTNAGTVNILIVR